MVIVRQRRPLPPLLYLSIFYDILGKLVNFGKHDILKKMRLNIAKINSLMIANHNKEMRDKGWGMMDKVYGKMNLGRVRVEGWGVRKEEWYDFSQKSRRIFSIGDLIFHEKFAKVQKRKAATLFASVIVFIDNWGVLWDILAAWFALTLRINLAPHGGKL